MPEAFSSRWQMMKFVKTFMSRLLSKEYETLKQQLIVQIECEQAYINYLDYDFVMLRPHIVGEVDYVESTMKYLRRVFGIKKKYFKPISKEEGISKGYKKTITQALADKHHRRVKSDLNEVKSKSKKSTGEPFKPKPNSKVSVLGASLSKLESLMSGITTKGNGKVVKRLKRPIVKNIDCDELSSEDETDTNEDDAAITFGGEEGSDKLTIGPLEIKEDSNKVSIIKRVINAYFSVVIKHFKSSVPKYVVKYLVSNVTQTMHASLLSEALESGNLQQLVEENSDIRTERSRYKNNILQLQTAAKAITEIIEQNNIYE